jgi:hypothetical protein
LSDHRGEGTDGQVGPLAPSQRAEDGPVKDRVKMLVGAVTVAVIGFVLYEGFVTLYGLYPGTRAGYLAPSERTAVAEVGTCRRLGPLSVDGFGYWWECAVTVRVEDGRVIHTVVDRSILTPTDAGRKVDFREACKRGQLTDCSYGRPVGRGWKALVGALILIEWMVVGLCAFLVLVLLVRAVLGRQGYIALYDRLNRKQRKSV